MVSPFIPRQILLFPSGPFGEVRPLFRNWIGGVPLRGLGLFDGSGQLVQKGRVVGFLDVVHVPKPRLPDFLARTVISEPLVQSGVNLGFSVVPYQRDGVPFEDRPVALRPRLIVDGHPEEGQITEIITDPTFQFEFLKAKLSAGTTGFPPHSGNASWRA